MEADLKFGFQKEQYFSKESDIQKKEKLTDIGFFGFSPDKRPVFRVVIFNGFGRSMFVEHQSTSGTKIGASQVVYKSGITKFSGHNNTVVLVVIP
jgi:hypothetical protein